MSPGEFQGLCQRENAAVASGSREHRPSTGWFSEMPAGTHLGCRNVGTAERAWWAQLSGPGCYLCSETETEIQGVNTGLLHPELMASQNL